MAFGTILEALAANAKNTPQRTIIRHIATSGGQYQDVNWAELYEAIQNLAAALVDQGLEPGDRVAILSYNRLEWIITDMAVMLAGGVSVALYHTNTAEQCAYILADSGARFVFVEDEEQVAKVLEHWDGLADLKAAVLYQGQHPASERTIFGFKALMDMGAKARPAQAPELDRLLALIDRDTLATLVYTSGTTGPPKGCMISHANLCGVLEAIDDFLQVDPEAEQSLLILPVSHLYPRVTGYYYNLYKNIPLALAQSIDSAAENMKQIRPTYFACVPRVFEKLYDRINGQIDQGPALKKSLLNWASGVGRRRSALILDHKPVPALLGLQHKIADALVFKKIRDQLGGRLRFAVSAGAPLSAEIGLFIHAIGVHVLEYYGLTECVGGTVTTFEHTRYGTVGRPMRGVELKIADDGEILLRGNVFMGYWNMPEKTAELIMDGWCHTGDVGRIDDDGYLVITDRKKDLIITAGGKNISPQNLENLLKRIPLVSVAMVHGDRRKYLTALLSLDQAETLAWAAAQGLATDDFSRISQSPEVRRMIQDQMDAINANLARFETIKKFAVLDRELSQEEGEITATLKVKRRIIEQKFKDMLDSLYE